jgi:hypothetical protein
LTGEAAFWNDHKYSHGAQVFWEGEPAEYIYQIRDGGRPTSAGITDDQLLSQGAAYLKEILEPDPRYSGW